MINVQEPPRVLNEYQRDDKILKNLYLVNIVAKEYRFLENSKYEDLIQEGRIGLIKAVDKFDPIIGTNFKTYALYHIKYNIQDFLRKESSLVYIPYNRLCKAFRLQRFIHSFIQNKNGTPPSEKEMRGFLHCNSTYLTDILLIVLILNNKINNIEEKYSYSSNMHVNIFNLNITSMMKSLYYEEELVLKEKYFENKSFREIGSILNFSHEKIRKIHNNGLLRLKSLLKDLEE